MNIFNQPRRSDKPGLFSKFVPGRGDRRGWFSFWPRSTSNTRGRRLHFWLAINRGVV